MKKIYTFNSETLEPEIVNTVKYKVYFVGSLLLFFILLSSFISAKKENIKYIQTEITINTRDTIQLKQDIFKEIDRLPFKFRHIVKAQAILESSHFKSPVFTQNMNTFGMRVARSRPTLCISENLGHAVYKSLEDCVLDRFTFEVLYLKNLSEEDYYLYLDRSYAEGNGYSKMLKSIVRSNNLK